MEDDSPGTGNESPGTADDSTRDGADAPTTVTGRDAVESVTALGGAPDHATATETSDAVVAGPDQTAQPTTPDTHQEEGSALLSAILGAVVTVVLSFTGFSPLLGGGVAGYLRRGSRMEGVRVGALSGALASLPFLFVFLAFGVFTGAMMRGIPGGFLVIVLLGFVFVTVWTVGLSALGGYLGVYVATETDLG